MSGAKKDSFNGNAKRIPVDSYALPREELGRAQLLQKGVSKHAFRNLNPSGQPVHLCLFRSPYSAVKVKDLHS